MFQYEEFENLFVSCEVCLFLDRIAKFSPHIDLTMHYHISIYKEFKYIKYSVWFLPIPLAIYQHGFYR